MSEEGKKKFWGNRRRFLALALLLGVFGTVALLFRHILIPFILALVIVYLIEPVVWRLSALGVKGRRLPRWTAVILVYVTFFGMVTGFSLLVVPPLAQEFKSLAQETPRFLERARTEHIPSLNRTLKRLLERYFPIKLSESHVQAARDEIQEAVAQGESLALLVAAMTPEERELYLLGGTQVVIEDGRSEAVAPAAFRVRYDEESEQWLITLGEVELAPHPDNPGSFILRTPSEEEPTAATSGVDFDLEESMNEALTGLVERSGEGVAKLINLGQDLVTALLGAFVGLVLTFMIAAFISIDLPSIKRYFRSAVPASALESYDDLLRRFDRGLAGVVRGQLFICLVNGVLTLVGLLLFQVKFAFILASFASILSLIPIFGTIISTIPCVSMALTQGLSVALLVLAWILMIHFVEANILNPKIIGTSAHIHPVIVVFALLAGEHTYGLLGALLAVPVASLFLTVFKFILERSIRNMATGEEGAG